MNEFGTGKSVFVLTIVAGCFAILWPNVFYPMINGTYSQKEVINAAQGCCDVIFDSDVNTIKVFTRICEKILMGQEEYDKKFVHSFQQGKLTKEIASSCQQTVYDKCGVNITQFLIEKVRLGRTFKQMLDEIRSLNSSICLKQWFGVSFGEIGLARRIRVWESNKSQHLRQERPPHLRPEFLHPALREKGRAIPHSHIVPKINIQEGRPGPVPGIRPSMGGAGQVTPPTKGHTGTMGIVMPMYTIGIVVFFVYTSMKMLLRKYDNTDSYESFTSDVMFQKTVLENSPKISYNKDIPDDGTKLGWRERDTIVTAISGLVEEVNRQIRSDQEIHLLDKEIETEDWKPAPNSTEEKEDEIEKPDEIETNGKSAVKVLGMEMTESFEGGAKWSRPSTPLSRPPTPQNIFLAGSLPSKSQLLVSESHTQTLPQQNNSVVLQGKVTLSLIGLPDQITSENGETNHSPSKCKEVISNSAGEMEDENGITTQEEFENYETDDEKDEAADIQTKEDNIEQRSND